MPDELAPSTPSVSFATHIEELDFLKSQGFPVNPLNSTAQSVREVWQKAEEINKKRDNLPFQIDGMVVKLNNNTLHEELGVVGKTPRGWCAIKFAAEEATTKLTGITWQVGRTGKVTPVAELEEVNLAGTTVKRATLHNAKEVLERNPVAGDTVVVRKAGDIIPEVVHILYNLRPHHLPQYSPSEETDSEISLLNQPTLPHNCPSCSKLLVESSTHVDLICPHSDTCPDQILFKLSYFTQRSIADITGLSDKIIQKFINEFHVHDIPDLFNLPYENIAQLEGFGVKSVTNLQQSVEKARTIEDYRLLAGLGIEGVGIEVSKLIVAELGKEENIV